MQSEKNHYEPEVYRIEKGVVPKLIALARLQKFANCALSQSKVEIKTRESLKHWNTWVWNELHYLHNYKPEKNLRWELQPTNQISFYPLKAFWYKFIWVDVEREKPNFNFVQWWIKRMSPWRTIYPVPLP